MIHDWANLILNVTIGIRVIRNLQDGTRAEDFILLIQMISMTSDFIQENREAKMSGFEYNNYGGVE